VDDNQTGERGRRQSGEKNVGETKKEEKMGRYVCSICGYVYDPAQGDPDAGIRKGAAFEDLPDDWVCPVCGAAKDDFNPE
jgi:rubredoxin